MNRITAKESKKWAHQAMSNDLLFCKDPIQNLELSVRSYNTVRSAFGMKATIGDLASISKAQFIRYKNSGRKSLIATVKQLDRYADMIGARTEPKPSINDRLIQLEKDMANLIKLFKEK